MIISQFVTVGFALNVLLGNKCIFNIITCILYCILATRISRHNKAHFPINTRAKNSQNNEVPLSRNTGEDFRQHFPSTRLSHAQSPLPPHLPRVISLSPFSAFFAPPSSSRYLLRLFFLSLLLFISPRLLFMLSLQWHVRRSDMFGEKVG